MKPGGRFQTVFQGPNGEPPNETVGCYLEVIRNQKLVWTSGLVPGYRPIANSKGDFDFPMTAVIELSTSGGKTKYKATALHRDEASRKAHEQMGFQQGWGIAFDQMIEMIKSW